jgi:hypothetical protein
LRDTAKALGLPIPNEAEPDVAGDAQLSPAIDAWADNSPFGKGSQPMDGEGSADGGENWRARQEAGWAASLPQQSEKDQSLAEAYLPPSLLHAYRAPMPKANRRYLDSNPFS